MSTHMPGFQSFTGCLHHFLLAKLAATSIRVNLLHTATLFGVTEARAIIVVGLNPYTTGGSFCQYKMLQKI